MTIGRSRRRRIRGRWEEARRALRYRLVIPIFRSPHPPEVTARGVANGVFWALTPSVGLQSVAITGTWLGARLAGRDSSLLQAFIWAWLNNPVTMIPLYYAFYVTGLWMLGDAGAGGYGAFAAMWDTSAHEPWRTRVGSLLGTVGWPMLIGCVPYATVAAAVAYAWTLRIVNRRRTRRRPSEQGVETLPRV